MSLSPSGPDSSVDDARPFLMEPSYGSPTEGTPRPDRTPQPEGKVYRSSGRPGLTSAGVAVLGTSISLVAALLSMLVTGSLSWVFGLPFVLISAYCAWEVRPDSMRTALVMPPLVMLLVAVAIPVVFGEVDGIRDGILRTLTTLTKLAPILAVAVAAAAAILAWRRWAAKRT